MRALLLPLFCRKKSNLKASIQHSVLYITRSREMDIFGLTLLLLNKDYRNRCHHFFIASSRSLYTLTDPFSLANRTLSCAEYTHYTMFVNPRESVYGFFLNWKIEYICLSQYIYTRQYAYAQWQWITITFSSQSIIRNVLAYLLFFCCLFSSDVFFLLWNIISSDA